MERDRLGPLSLDLCTLLASAVIAAQVKRWEARAGERHSWGLGVTRQENGTRGPGETLSRVAKD